MAIVGLFALSGIVFQFLGTVLSFPQIYVVPLSALFILNLHLWRPDKQFMRELTASAMQRVLVMGAEYSLLLLPVLVFHVVKGHFLAAGLLSVVPWLIATFPTVNIRVFTPRRFKARFIPLQLFEIKIAIERYCIFFLVFWSIAFLGFLHPAYFLVSLLFALVILVSGFAYNETLDLMEGRRNFISEKLLSNVGFALLFFMPQLVLTALRHSDDYLVLSYGLLYFVSILSLAILYKYAKYNPLRSSTLNSTLVTISMVLGLMPGLVIGSVIVCVYYYFKAKQNISYYL